MFSCSFAEIADVCPPLLVSWTCAIELITIKADAANNIKKFLLFISTPFFVFIVEGFGPKVYE